MGMLQKGDSRDYLRYTDDALELRKSPMATSNSPTCGHPNSSGQDGQIIGV